MTAASALHSADGAVLGLHVDDVTFLAMLGVCTVANQREAERWVRERATLYPQGLGLVVVIDAEAPTPDGEVRREIDAVYGRLAPRIRAVAYSVEGTGFKAAGARAVLTGINLLTRRSYPSTVAGDLRAALAWLFSKLGPDPRRGTAEAMVAAFESARSAAPKPAGR